MIKSLYNSPSLVYIALIFGIICIGFSAIFVKLANVPGSVSAFYRILVAAVAILPIWIYKGTKVPPKRDLWLIFIGAFFFSLDLFLWNTAILLTSAATATLLANNAPVWVGLISLVVFRERLAPRFWYGLLVALVGLNVLIGLQSWATMQFNLGDVLSIVAGFFYALYLTFTLDSRKRIDTITFMTFSILFMVVILFFINLTLGNPFTGFTRQTWMSLVGLGLVSHFAGWVAINFALGHLKGANVSVTLLAQSVVTALVAIPILGEAITTNQIIGGILILGGIYIVNRRSK
ncbi:MAG: DMT family transporter [Bacteroidales bacterium]|nr:DMT family transporter [Bacteroidales bacterium]